MICFLDGTFVIMFIFGLSLPLLLIIFWMFFELTLLEKLDLPLIMSISMSMSMSILHGILAIVGGCEVIVEMKRCIFSNFLMGTTIQDGSKRERINEMM